MSGPSPEEAAAAIAALERHLAQAARRAGRTQHAADRWSAAGLPEAGEAPSPWGRPHPWIKT